MDKKYPSGELSISMEKQWETTKNQEMFKDEACARYFRSRSIRSSKKLKVCFLLN